MCPRRMPEKDEGVGGWNIKLKLACFNATTQHSPTYAEINDKLNLYNHINKKSVIIPNVCNNKYL